MQRRFELSKIRMFYSLRKYFKPSNQTFVIFFHWNITKFTFKIDRVYAFDHRKYWVRQSKSMSLIFFKSIIAQKMNISFALSHWSMSTAFGEHLMTSLHSDVTKVRRRIESVRRLSLSTKNSLQIVIVHHTCARSHQSILNAQTNRKCVIPQTIFHKKLSYRRDNARRRSSRRLMSFNVTHVS